MSWTLLLTVTDCSTGRPMPGVGTVAPGVQINPTDANGQAALVDVLDEYTWYYLTINREGYLSQTHLISRPQTELDVCMQRLPNGVDRPAGLTVVDSSPRHCTIAWTNPTAYDYIHVGWSTVGGQHHQTDRPGGTTQYTYRTAFTPGVEYDLKVQGKVGLNPWTGWAQVRWRCPTPPPPPGQWFGQHAENLGPAFPATSVAAFSARPGRTDVYHIPVGDPHKIAHRWEAPGYGWNYEVLDVAPHRDIYGHAACARGDGHDILYVGGRTIWHLRYREGVGYQPAQPIGEHLPVPPGTRLVACSWGPDRIDVFYCGANNHLIQRFYSAGNWSGDVDLGPGLADHPPGAISRGPNLIDVYFRGPDNDLHARSWTGNAWEDSHFGRNDVAGAVNASHTPGRVDIIYRTTARGWGHYFLANGQWNQVDLPPGPVSNPGRHAVASWAPGRVDVFYDSLAVDPGLGMWHHWT